MTEQERRQKHHDAGLCHAGSFSCPQKSTRGSRCERHYEIDAARPKSADGKHLIADDWRKLATKIARRDYKETYEKYEAVRGEKSHAGTKFSSPRWLTVGTREQLNDIKAKAQSGIAGEGRALMASKAYNDGPNGNSKNNPVNNPLNQAIFDWVDTNHSGVIPSDYLGNKMALPTAQRILTGAQYEQMQKDLATTIVGALRKGPRTPRKFQQSAIERAADQTALLAAINARLAHSPATTGVKISKPKRVQPTWYITLTGYDGIGNEALKTGFTGYEGSVRPEASKTYNPRGTQKLLTRSNICAKDTKVWEEVLRNQINLALDSHELDHEVFYGKPENRSRALEVFEIAAKNTEELYKQVNA